MQTFSWVSFVGYIVTLCFFFPAFTVQKTAVLCFRYWCSCLF